jgi:hypothetical protein
MNRFTLSALAATALAALVPGAARAEPHTVTLRTADPAFTYVDANGITRDPANPVTHLVWLGWGAPGADGWGYSSDSVTEDAFVIDSHPAWANIEGGRWISWSPGIYGSSYYSPGMGPYERYFTYEAGFDLPGGIQRPSLTLQYSADDWVDVYVNGQKIVDQSAVVFGTVQQPAEWCTFTCITTVVVTDPALFVAGRNTLQFQQHEPDGIGGLDYLATMTYEDPAPVQDPTTGNVYQRFDTSRNWFEAKAFCEANGGHLATVTSPGENDLVYRLCSGAAPQWCWLGATDKDSEGAWKWVNGERWGYTNWAAGEPNNCAALEHFLMYFNPPDGRAGTWNDLGSFGSGGMGCGGESETYRMSTICEFDRVPVDVKPGGCPNPIKLGSTGPISVAIVGTASIDPAAIDPLSVRVQGVTPSKSSVADVATPYAPWFGKATATACTAAAADGFADLVLQVDVAKLIAALGNPPAGSVKVVKVTGKLRPELGGTPFEGEDVVQIQKK